MKIYRMLFVGRLKRGPFNWVIILGLICIAILNILYVKVFGPYKNFTDLLWYVSFQSICYILLAPVVIKRLHDVNLTGQLGWLFMVPLILNPALYIALKELHGVTVSPAVDLTVYLVFMTFGLTGLGLLFYLMFARGSRERNRYG
jgi:uncharacterized membrane protein YhaH (DUF805 family)